MINKRKEFPGSLEVKDSALSLLWLRFSPGHGNFCHNEEQKDKHEDVKKIKPCLLDLQKVLEPIALALGTKDLGRW